MKSRRALMAGLAATAALVALPAAANADGLPALPAFPSLPTWTLPTWPQAAAMINNNNGDNTGTIGACEFTVSGGRGPTGAVIIPSCLAGGVSTVGPSHGQAAHMVGAPIASATPLVGDQINRSGGAFTGP